MTEITPKERLTDIERVIGAALNEARSILAGKEATLTSFGSPMYAGYRGKISNVIASADGEILACFYVYRRGTTEIINGKSWTRQYRPLSHLDVNL